MKQIALIFPGQGAQYTGMGMDFYAASPESRKIFDLADEIIQNDFKNVIFQGPQEKLTLTAYSQPGIVAMSMAALAAFKASPKFKDVEVKFAAGLSLGEYSAITAAGAIDFPDAVRLIQKRSQFMEEATKLNAGKMSAIIGVDREKIIEVCKQTGAEVANFNSPQQIVISGHAAKVEAAAKLLQEAGAKNVVFLEVSGAFHSSLMAPAAEKFSRELAGAPLVNAQFPIISNVDASPATDAEKIRANLARQITSSVQWVDSVNFIIKQGVTDFVEIGPGKVLKGLIRRIDPSASVYNIEKFADIEALPF